MAETALQPRDVFLELVVSRVESDLAQAFLRGSVTLGGAAARSETDLSLTGSKQSTTLLVTERETTIRVPLNTVHQSSENPQHYFQRYKATK